MSDLSDRIGILHLSDIHFRESGNIIIDRPIKIINAIKTDCYHIKKLFIVASGDIAFSGLAKEYEIALEFFSELQDGISKECNGLIVKFIFVPGNHDCDFSLSSKQRENNLKRISQVGYDAIDDAVIDTCTEIQRNFFDFTNIYSIDHKNKLAYEFEDNIGGVDIIFNCYNTAWLSEKRESPGNLFFPVKNIKGNNTQKFSIGVFHHPCNWLTPESQENNSKEFINYLQENSNLILSGHEHEFASLKTTNLSSGNGNILIEGGVLQEQGINSAFNLICVDLIDEFIDIAIYSWQEEEQLYLSENDKKNIPLSCTYSETFKLNEDFKAFLNETSIPILKDGKANIFLDDLYLYPKLESVEDKKQRIDDFIDSFTLCEINNNKYKYIIEGCEQAGKTSLCKKLFMNYYSKNFVPLYITGRKITNSNTKQITKTAFKQQYEDSGTGKQYQKYLQLDKKNKILFIDNLGYSALSVKKQDELINELSREYPYILITVNDTYGIENIVKEKSELVNFKLYRLKPFGYNQRNKLIEKWKILGDEKNYDEKELIDYAEITLRKINEILGVNLMPAYPANIILLLQTLETAMPHDLNKTSYGHCYETLIVIRLSQKIGHDKLDSYFNFITELSFHMYNYDLSNMTREEIELYLNTSYNFIIKKGSVIDDLLDTSILTIDSMNNISFKYKYIYYYFIARYLSQNETIQTQKTIKFLCNNIHISREANILIFLTHHAKNKELLEDIQLTTMSIFENQKEMSLSAEEIKFMNDLGDIISQKYIEDRSPRKEKESRLKLQDKINSEKNDDKLDSEDDVLNDINKALKSIEVIGQITKNRFGSIKEDQLEEIIEDACNTGLRALAFFIDLFQKEETEEALFEIVSEKFKDKDFDKIKIKQEIHKTLQFFSYISCHFFINKIANSMGSRQLEACFNHLAAKHQTPIYELIHFIVKTRFSEAFPIDRLKRLLKKYKKNMLVIDILNKGTIDYIYMHKIKFKDKQKISTIINIPIEKQLIIEDKENKI